MHTNIRWKGLAYHSNEQCQLTQTSSGITANSTISGNYQASSFKVTYSLEVTEDWEISSGKIMSKVDTSLNVFTFKKNADGSWIINGTNTSEFAGCIDIDISLTPFTNSLPINRLIMPVMSTQQIQVIYFDLLEGNVLLLKQCYTKISAGKYRYENVPNDFEAVIETDESGLVLNYPGLFTRI